MAMTSLGGYPVHTAGDLPAVGSTAPDFTLTGPNLKDDVTRPEGRRVVLNIFPSVETGVCSASVRRFNQLAAGLENTTVICVSQDLPFALGNFCAAEGIDDVVAASSFRSSFGEDYGVMLLDGAFRGLLARSVIVLDGDGRVIHQELVPSMDDEPDYDAAVAALG
ncbi:peroxidase [Intrasporangium oryzae NRRL B-24470]|uniref:Thiol peroxidase n=1 Tax=Intrasporangium oryzae NRRL B-24470 TaxID=1386089 RepID=W9G645_9MICO|nr:thiol peroxidase [Intrasporangium oryzae]EWT00273.1 peroxidase [Intrasporangium oryzae NRRL B-24470]